MDRRPIPRFHPDEEGRPQALSPPGSELWWGFTPQELFGPKVTLAPGLVAPERVTAWRRFEEYVLAMTITAVPGADGRAGRFVCSYLELHQVDDGPTVTSESIRRVPVGSLLRDLAWALWMQTGQPPKGEESDWLDGAWRHELSKDEAAKLREQGPTAETLGWVAHHYRLALVFGEPPTQAVERALGLPRSTAGRWVTAARSQGLLGPAEGAGKAGG